MRASLIQILFSIRSERQRVQHIDDNLLYCWFVGLAIDDSVWDHSTFSHNRDRLFNEGLARVFFERVRTLADWQRWTSSEHFSVDGTLIDAWASHKSFRPQDGDGPRPPGRNLEVDFKGQPRANDPHASTTDPDARLFKKAEGAASWLCPMSHVRMENRNGLVVDVATTLATGKAERQAVLKRLVRHARRGATVGADKGDDTADFVAGCRRLGVTPHVARKKTGSAMDGRTTRHAGDQTALKGRKRIGSLSGWWDAQHA